MRNHCIRCLKNNAAYQIAVLWNNRLTKCTIFTPNNEEKFSSKEAQKIVDGQLKNMVQDIRKVEGRVIKTWMTAAKAGKIDFFDIIRGLKTGDIRRAHTFEMDFFVKLLTRNKIVDRFRSYFKGKKGKKR